MIHERSRSTTCCGGSGGEVHTLLVGISLRVGLIHDMLSTAVGSGSRPWAGSERVAARRAASFSVGTGIENRRSNGLLGEISLGRWRWWNPGQLETITTPAKRNARSLSRRSDVDDEETTLETYVKSRVLKLALTLGALATALLAGAASFKVG